MSCRSKAEVLVEVVLIETGDGGLQDVGRRSPSGRPAPAVAVDVTEAAPLEPPIDGVAAAIDLARAVAADGQQRALEHPAGDLEELQRLRVAVRSTLCAEADGSPLRHVLPWLWQTTSGGTPLTAAGADTGFELRLSRYAKLGLRRLVL